ncbi:MAG: hypothetical protein DHS20C15_04410 [Planctomycetota bacterium]|nr:MAG: hypothetical protein DHS20C15_04410 [Planctomycetota bacterium]
MSTTTPPIGSESAAQRDTDTAGADDTRRAATWKRAYAARTPDDLLALYADWAAQYEADHAAIGYRGHELASEVLERHLPASRAPRLLDAGAGTGLAGAALAKLGHQHLSGYDLSPDMLEQARAKGVYERLAVADLGVPLDDDIDDSYDGAILVGVFSFGQAPAHTLDEIVRVVRPGGFVVFTMRTDFHESNAMEVAAKLTELEASGVWRLAELTEPEPYLPKKDPDARFRVWCYEVLPTKRQAVPTDFAEAVGVALDAGGPIYELAHHHIWDATSSRLYDAYIQRPEYYLNDSEEEILRVNAGEFLGDRALCVELGCGSAEKIKHVFRAVLGGDPTATVDYIPIDLSPGALETNERQIREAFGDRVRVDARLGSFDETLATLPADQVKAIFFLGGSIGNFPSIDDTVSFLGTVRERLTPRDRFVVGFDLTKDAHVFEAAYNAGQSNRLFFLHMVRRMNRLLGADFDLSAFELASTYDRERSDSGVSATRVNLKVVNTRAQHVTIPALDRELDLAVGDCVQVGISRKFGPDDVGALAGLAGLRVRSMWFDTRHYFCLTEFVRDDAPAA